jgi:hypothetical protein
VIFQNRPFFASIHPSLIMGLRACWTMLVGARPGFLTLRGSVLLSCSWCWTRPPSGVPLSPRSRHYFQDFVSQELRRVGLTADDLRAVRPAAPKRTRASKKER